MYKLRKGFLSIKQKKILFKKEGMIMEILHKNY